MILLEKLLSCRAVKSFLGPVKAVRQPSWNRKGSVRDACIYSISGFLLRKQRLDSCTEKAKNSSFQFCEFVYECLVALFWNGNCEKYAEKYDTFRNHYSKLK